MVHFTLSDQPVTCNSLIDSILEAIRELNALYLRHFAHMNQRWLSLTRTFSYTFRTGTRRLVHPLVLQVIWVEILTQVCN